LNLWEHSYWEEHDGQADSTYLDNFWKNIDWLKVSNNFELYNLKGEVANIL
jgi:superoxide dismutase